MKNYILENTRTPTVRKPAIPRKTYLWDPSEPNATRVLVMSLFDATGSYEEDLYYTHDAQKNTNALFGIKAGRRALYQYGAYGNLIKIDGAIASLNPFRFSSEYHDDELALIYYNYRYLNPKDGRWINRDPIHEQGGINLYGYVGNKGILNQDTLGLKLKTHNAGEYPIEQVSSITNGDGITKSKFKANVQLHTYLNFGFIDVHVQGDLEMTIQVEKNKNTQRSILHEKHHVNIYMKYWNMIVEEINYLETEWCKPCHKLAVTYGNAAISLRFQQANVEGSEFDVNDYTRLKLRDIDKQKTHYKQARINLQSKINTYNQAIQQFYETCLKGKQAVIQTMDFPEDPLQSNFNFPYSVD